MAGVATLIGKLRDRLTLDGYAPWEHDFLTRVLADWDRAGSIPPADAETLKTIVRRRWVQGHRSPVRRRPGGPRPKPAPSPAAPPPPPPPAARTWRPSWRDRFPTCPGCGRVFRSWHNARCRRCRRAAP